MFFDLLENSMIGLLMWRGVSPVLAGAATVFTMLKWTWVGVSLLIVLGGIWHRRRARATRAELL